MKLILKQSVEHLGEPGQVVDVKPGFARNYLLPQGLAYEASAENIARLEQEQREAEEASRRNYLEAKRRASQMEGLRLQFRARAGEGEDAALFGSITAADIADRANEGSLDFELDRRTVMLDSPIKSLGDSRVTVRLHPEVEVEVVVTVEREED
jgi:large subunit ribosomal protein L9